MFRTIMVSALIMASAAGLSHYLVGYDRGGTAYVERQRQQRRSLRVGSYRGVYYSGHGPYSSRGPRFGK